MASNPAIREGILKNLRLRGGSVYGSTRAEVVERVKPKGVSMSQAMVALNSLAYTTNRPRQIVIHRTGESSGIDGGSGGFHVCCL